MARNKSTKAKKKTTTKNKTAFLRAPNKLRKKSSKKNLLPIKTSKKKAV